VEKAMKAPASKAEQDVEEMLQSFRDSFAKTRADAGGSAPPPPPPPQTAKPDMSKSGGSKWGDLKAGKSESASIPAPSFSPPPIPTPSAPRAYTPPPAAKSAPVPPPVPSSSAPKAGGSKWGALKEGVKEPTNAIERAKLVKEQEKAATAPPPPPRGVSAEEIDIVKPTGGGDSFTARIKAAQAAKAGSR
jgi:hypothetical protein